MSKQPTKDEKTRMERLSLSGCVVCRLQHGAFVENQVHHMTAGGRRLGHRFTIPLCPWHHQGKCVGEYPTAEMTRIYGPSFANGRKDFEAAFGSEEHLLDETDKWLGVWKPKIEV